MNPPFVAFLRLNLKVVPEGQAPVLLHHYAASTVKNEPDIVKLHGVIGLVSLKKHKVLASYPK
jgi:hypothetical protein